ncbi:MAG: hypothetical protein ACLR5G_03825 [Eubacteriales bacterium]
MKNDPKKYVRECESEYSERISAAAAEILKRGTRFITLSGPSCSGKTTAARRIADQLSRDGRDVRIISIDNFFRSREKGEKRRWRAEKDRLRFGRRAGPRTARGFFK